MFSLITSEIFQSTHRCRYQFRGMQNKKNTACRGELQAFKVGWLKSCHGQTLINEFFHF